MVGQSWVRLLIYSLCSWSPFALYSSAKAGVGPYSLTLSLLLQDRVQALQSQQPERSMWHTAVMGKEGFELWEFKTNRMGMCLASKCSSIVHFSLDIDSAGFQRFVRWLATDLKVGASLFPEIGCQTMQIGRGHASLQGLPVMREVTEQPLQQSICLFLAADAWLHLALAARRGGPARNGDRQRHHGG